MDLATWGEEGNTASFLPLDTITIYALVRVKLRYFAQFWCSHSIKDIDWLDSFLQKQWDQSQKNYSGAE